MGARTPPLSRPWGNAMANWQFQTDVGTVAGHRISAPDQITSLARINCSARVICSARVNCRALGKAIDPATLQKIAHAVITIIFTEIWRILNKKAHIRYGRKWAANGLSPSQGFP